MVNLFLYLVLRHSSDRTSVAIFVQSVVAQKQYFSVQSISVHIRIDVHKDHDVTPIVQFASKEFLVDSLRTHY